MAAVAEAEEGCFFGAGDGDGDEGCDWEDDDVQDSVRALSLAVVVAVVAAVVLLGVRFLALGGPVDDRPRRSQHSLGKEQVG